MNRRPLRVALLALAAVVAGTLPAVLVPSPAPAVAGSDLIITAAGIGTTLGATGEGGSATRAAVRQPRSISIDAAGNLYVPSDHVTNQVNWVGKIDSSGVITIVAGKGKRGFSGDGGPATEAELDRPWDVEADAGGNLYVSDHYNSRVRRVDAASGIITTVAGNGTSGRTGDSGAAKEAQIARPTGLALDGAGRLFISGSNHVRMVTPGADGVVDGDEDEIITTVAGPGSGVPKPPGIALPNGDGGPATDADVLAYDLEADAAGNLYIASDTRVRRVDNSGIISTVAGNGTAGSTGDNGAATAAQVAAYGIHVDVSGTLYLSGANRVRKVTPGPDALVDGDTDDVISTVAGTGTAGYLGDNGPAASARLNVPDYSDAEVGPAGDLYIADYHNHRIRRVGPDGPLRLVMVDSADPVGLGGELTYTATVTNASATSATAVALSDTLPAAASFVSAVPDQGSCSHSNGTVSCALGEIRTGATATVVIKVNAPGEPMTLSNRAQVSSAEPDPYGRDNIAVEPTVVKGPDLSLSVVDAPDPVEVGTELTYNATVTNAGPGPANGVAFRDTLPAGTTFGSVQPSQGACTHAGDIVSCELGTIFPGRTAAVRIRLTAASEPTTLANSATVAAVEPDPAPANNSDTDQTAVIAPVPRVSLSLTTTDTPEPVTVGQPLAYDFTVTNDGTVPATGGVLTIPLPSGVTYRTGGCSHSSTKKVVTCTVGDLAPGAEKAFKVVVEPTRSDLLSTTATVSSAEPEATPADNTDVEQTVVSTTGVPIGLGLATVDRPDPAMAGQPFTYEFTATNGGPVPATGDSDDPAAHPGVILTDTLAAGVEFVSATSENGTCSKSGGTVTCNLGSIDPGAYVRAAITVVAPATGNLTNTASVSSPDAPGATSVVSTDVAAAPCGMVITKDTVLDGDVGPCESVGIVLGADNITLDLGGHRVFGTPGPSKTELNGNKLGNQPGIYLPGRNDVTVKNGTVTDFDAGVFLRGGGSNTITGLIVKDNIGPAGSNSAELGDGIVLFDSANNRIVANSVIHNGAYDGIGVLGGGSDGNVVEDNLVEDTYAVTPKPGQDWEFSHGQGIILNASSLGGDPTGLVVNNTRVLRNVVRRSAQAGISNVNTSGSVIWGNTVEGNGLVNYPGNGIGFSRGPGGTNVTNAMVQNNEVHGNADRGIYLWKDVSGIKVLNNNATGNKGYDLRDDHSDCSANTWEGNVADAYSYSPDCTAAPDTTGPDTKIVSGPAASTTVDTPSFEFSSPEPSSTFECRVDTEAFASCTSPHTTAVLSTGPHSFEVRATDPAGNVDPSPAIRSFSVGAAAVAASAIADFNGDGATDISVFRAGSGSWFPQGGAADAWGTEGDVAVPADYDGASGSEMGVFRPLFATWFVKGGQTTGWGTEGDLPVPGDYDGDKKADVAVFRPSTGAWYIRPSGGGPEQSLGWGTIGDIPVPGDYNGDGTSEMAVFRPSSGTWFVLGGPTIAWGTEGDIPVPGDYDANGTTDMAVFRPSSGTWFVNGGATLAWGTDGDIPVPGDFDGNASADIAVFRPSSGTWFVNGGATTNWGTAGDQPLPLPPAIRQSLQ